MSGPDKPKVLDELWNDERVKSFLDLEPYDKTLQADHFVLLRAYEAMRAEDFERFVGFFVAAGRNLDATDEHGETMLDRISQHGRSGDYARALENAGAKTPAGN
ncbi:PA4642 family protein [Marinobacter sp. AL4B]|uniref:PA4642 family protein n=1 Tax=Marinobacter sp. AL4B TaxID=2871173 RepID=UPI001CAA6BD7|nr:PA4642 family protein [Marinobacter sp. AL4B]MBZ0335398.1 PA4642 family protein [Marinobacter sp. AL4B]